MKLPVLFLASFGTVYRVVAQAGAMAPLLICTTLETLSETISRRYEAQAHRDTALARDAFVQ